MTDFNAYWAALSIGALHCLLVGCMAYLQDGNATCGKGEMVGSITGPWSHEEDSRVAEV